VIAAARAGAPPAALPDPAANAPEANAGRENFSARRLFRRAKAGVWQRQIRPAA
jgi:hypothetical protein